MTTHHLFDACILARHATHPICRGKLDKTYTLKRSCIAIDRHRSSTKEPSRSSQHPAEYKNISLYTPSCYDVKSMPEPPLEELKEEPKHFRMMTLQDVLLLEHAVVVTR